MNDTDAVNLGGAKRGLRSDLRKMSIREFHENHGHLGSCGGGELCEMCVRKRGNKYPLRALDKMPVRDQRPGFRFHLDATCWNEENLEGERFTFSMRGSCTGLYNILNTHTRSDFYAVFEE